MKKLTKTQQATPKPRVLESILGMQEEAREVKTQTVWHDGPPPHIGWWNASVMKAKDCWRWWDGKVWSLPMFPTSDMSWVISKAQTPRRTKESMTWTHYYPTNARVPRVDPAKLAALRSAAAR